jgi:choline dehydrogenase-like flavoprotein
MDPVVVIGSGMSGAAVAGELLRGGVPTVIAEIGPHRGTVHVAAVDATRGWLEPHSDPYFQPFRPDASLVHYGAHAGRRLRVGGRSLYWRGIVLRVEDYALADWPIEIRRALEGGNAEGQGYYAQVEQRLAAWAGRRLRDARNVTETLLVRHFRAMGFADAEPAPRAMRQFEGGLWSAYSPLEEIAPARVLSERTVVELASSGDCVDVALNSVRGLERLRAAAVVLCAGAIENARIVSWLTGRQEAYRLVDHHAQGWVCVRANPIIGTNELEASVLLRQDQTTRINAFVELHRIEEHMVIDAWTMGEQLPSKGATVRFVPPELTPTFAVERTSDDDAVLAKERSFLVDLCGALGFALDGETDDDGPCDYDAAMSLAMSEPGVAVSYRCPLGTVDHEACTLPLGGELVDTRGELRDAPLVFVAGPCLFPRAGAANPSLTTLAVSGYVASHVYSRVTRDQQSLGAAAGRETG